MNATKIILCLAIFMIGQANGQRYSTQWYQEKDISWQQARAQFPESSHPGAFKARMLVIDEWAKENNPDLYSNSNKPLILAQMVQREIDDQAAAQRDAVARQQASQQAPAPQRVLEPNRNSSDAGNSGLTRPALGVIWLGGIVIAAVVFSVAYLAYRILRPKSGLESPLALGRTWLAWAVAFATICMLPTHFRFDFTKSIILWGGAVVFFGGSAFFIGWIIGLIKYKGTKGGTPGVDCPPIPSEGSFYPANPEIELPPPIMKNNEYEVTIPEGKDLGNGYVGMIHQTQYSLLLRNHRDGRCDAEVVIDGIKVGTWRVNSRGEIRIERPVHDNGHFTFFEVGTLEANAADIEKADKNGLISVTFRPETRETTLKTADLPTLQGATGLTGESEQRFVNAETIIHDDTRSFTIHIRLVSSRQNIRPLAPRSTPIPPPVG